MRISLLTALTGVALLSLTACNKPAPAASGPASPSADAAAPTPPATPTPGAMPHRKAGLWEQRMSIGAAAEVVTQMCLDDAVQDRLSVMGQRMDRSKCSTYSMNHQLNGDWVFNSVCSLGSTGGTSTSSGVLHGDFGNSFHLDMDTRIEGSSIAQMNGQRKMTMDGKWLGPCQPGQKPGDVMVNGMTVRGPGGQRVDLNKLRAMAAAARG